MGSCQNSYVCVCDCDQQQTKSIEQYSQLVSINDNLKWSAMHSTDLRL